MIPDYETIQREGWDTPAAEWWKQRAEKAEARVAALREALDGVRAWMLTIRSNEAPPAFVPTNMMECLRDTAAAAQAHDARVREEMRERCAILADQVGKAQAAAIRALILEEPTP